MGSSPAFSFPDEKTAVRDPDGRKIASKQPADMAFGHGQPQLFL